ncbi:MAG: hypothetical protein IJP92_08845 [Lachnospiraceae bacterium]|nr:hypothetical protein [Lachnospiraceae bacterium]
MPITDRVLIVLKSVIWEKFKSSSHGSVSMPQRTISVYATDAFKVSCTRTAISASSSPSRRLPSTTCISSGMISA